jgi:hypothetical protein
MAERKLTPHNYHDILVDVKPATEGKLYFTEENTELIAFVANRTDRERKGKIVISIHFGAVAPTTVRQFFPISLDLKPKEGKQVHFNITNFQEGQVFIGIAEIGSPEIFRNKTEAEAERAAEKMSIGIILFSYRVLDKAIHQVESDRFEKLGGQIAELKTQMAQINKTINETIETRLAELGLTKPKVAETIVKNQQEEAIPQKKERPLHIG